MIYKEKLNTLVNLTSECNEEVIKSKILNIYFPMFTSFNSISEIDFTIRYKRFTLFKLIGLPKKIYKKYYLILINENKEINLSISFKERKLIGELLNKLVFKDRSTFEA